MSEILTTQFLETIADIGAIQLYVSERDGHTSTFFTGPSENFVQIQSSLEYLPERLGVNYLVQLGFKEYIERIFPGFLDRLRKENEEREREENSDEEDD